MIKRKNSKVAKVLKDFFLFNTDLVQDLHNVRKQIIEENRKFSVIWSFVSFIYGVFCLFMSFYEMRFMLCRNAYIMLVIVSSLGLLCAALMRKKSQFMYFAVFLNYFAILGAGFMIAHILLQNGNTGTIMIFASLLIVPIIFVSSTLLNVIIAFLFVVATAVFMNGLPAEIYRWCIINVIIFAVMGVTIGHFINKTRFERYVFEESAFKLAELQTRYAYYDQMTTLRNRRAYSEKLEEYAVEMPSDCWAVMLDINSLKKMNDTFGHEAGDELITSTAECLRRSFEGIETIYRIGGDEFCVISNGSEEEITNGLKKLEKICADWKGKYVRGISIAYGYATAKEFSDFVSLLKAADNRMYAFKNKCYNIEGNI